MNNVNSSKLIIHSIESNSSAGVIAEVSEVKGSKRFPMFIPSDELELRRELHAFGSKLTHAQRNTFFSLVDKWADYCVDEEDEYHAELAAGEDI